MAQMEKIPLQGLKSENTKKNKGSFSNITSCGYAF